MSELALVDLVGIGLVAVGVAFDVFGCIGLVRLPDVYNRLQAATKCVTVGTCFVIGGAALLVGTAAGAVKGVLCVLFLLVTAPAAAHALARAAHRSGVAPCDATVVDRYAQDRAAPSEMEEAR